MPKREKRPLHTVEFAAYEKARSIAIEVLKNPEPSRALINNIRDCIVQLDKNDEVDEDETEETLNEWHDARSIISKIHGRLFETVEPPSLEVSLDIFARLSYDDDDEIDEARIIETLTQAKSWASQVYHDVSPAAIFDAFDRAFEELE